MHSTGLKTTTSGISWISTPSMSHSRRNAGACENLLCPHLLTVYQITRHISLVCRYCQADFFGEMTP